MTSLTGGPRSAKRRGISSLAYSGRRGAGPSIAPARGQGAACTLQIAAEGEWSCLWLGLRVARSARYLGCGARERVLHRHREDRDRAQPHRADRRCVGGDHLPRPALRGDGDAMARRDQGTSQCGRVRDGDPGAYSESPGVPSTRSSSNTRSACPESRLFVQPPDARLGLDLPLCPRRALIRELSNALERAWLATAALTARGVCARSTGGASSASAPGWAASGIVVSGVWTPSARTLPCAVARACGIVLMVDTSSAPRGMLRQPPRSR